MYKECSYCKQAKPLSEFFSAPDTGAASWQGTSEFCIECHAAGYIQHGYGFYGDKWQTPDFDVLTKET